MKPPPPAPTLSSALSQPSKGTSYFFPPPPWPPFSPPPLPLLDPDVDDDPPAWPWPASLRRAASAARLLKPSCSSLDVSKFSEARTGASLLSLVLVSRFGLLYRVRCRGSGGLLRERGGWHVPCRRGPCGSARLLRRPSWTCPLWFGWEDGVVVSLAWERRRGRVLCSEGSCVAYALELLGCRSVCG